MRNLNVRNLFCYGLGGLSWMFSNVLFFGQKWQSYSQYYFNGYESGHEQAIADIKNGTNITLPQGADFFEKDRPFWAYGITVTSNITYALISVGGMELMLEKNSKISKFTKSALCMLMGYGWYLFCKYDFSGAPDVVNSFKDMGQYSGYINGVRNITGNPHDPVSEAFAFLGDETEVMNYLYATLLMGVIYLATALRTSYMGENFTLAYLCQKMKCKFLTFSRLEEEKDNVELITPNRHRSESGAPVLIEFEEERDRPESKDDDVSLFSSNLT